VVRLDASTGKQIWKTYNVDEPKPWKKNPNGVQLYGPSAGGIWNAPTIDPFAARCTSDRRRGDAAGIAADRRRGGDGSQDRQGAVVYRAANQDLFMGGCNGPTRSERARARWARTSTSATRRSS
jgi:hypothetical protein